MIEVEEEEKFEVSYQED